MTPTDEQRERVRKLCERYCGPRVHRDRPHEHVEPKDNDLWYCGCERCICHDGLIMLRAYGDERAAEAQGIIERQGEIIEDLRRQLGLPETPEAALFEALSETRTLASGVTLIQRVDLSAHAEREAQERGEEER